MARLHRLPTRHWFEGGRLDVVASFTQSFRNTGAASLKRDQLVFRHPRSSTGVRFIFVVDSSGSHRGAAADARRERSSRRVIGILGRSQRRSGRHIVSRGEGGDRAATVPATRKRRFESSNFCRRAGGRPLAHALELAGQLVNPASVLILLTDGRANVPSKGADPWADALEAAGKLNCPSILVDSSLDDSSLSAIQVLASAMGARRILLDDLKESAASILRPV